MPTSSSGTWPKLASRCHGFFPRAPDEDALGNEQARPSSDDYLPFFSCKAVGDVLLDVAQSHSKCQILVLCDHTHGGGEIQVAKNLRVVTGPAEYGKPEIQQVLRVG